MKYNKELYMLSEELLEDSNYEDSVDNKYEIELLKVLLNKVKNARLENNMIKITFNYPIFGNPESGYNLIYSLVKSDKFNKIANEYGFYLSSINMNHSEYSDDNIEIIWDYKSYNESIKTLKLTNNS